jgi:hypothetical protein
MLTEGFTAPDDDEHTSGELILAALGYALEAVPSGAPIEATGGVLVERRDDAGTLPTWWPWDADWWRPAEDPIRNLEKAGALIAAEIDRLTRKKHRDSG